MGDKIKFHRDTALAAVREILNGFVAERIIIAGSLRRRKALVGDIEVVYIPKIVRMPDSSDLFQAKVVEINLTDRSLEGMIASGLLGRRATALGAASWGDKNKYARHMASGIPVDFFATSERCWANYLVCRTGGKESNKAIATAAQKKGWQWHPYSWGFTDEEGRPVEAATEREVFEKVGLKYLEPWERE